MKATPSEVMTKFHITVPAPVSKKNSGQIRYTGRGVCPTCNRRLGRPFYAPSGKAQADQRQIAADCREQLLKAGHRDVLFPTEDVGVSIVVDPKTKTMQVEVEAIRERPKGFSGRRRDLHAHIDVLMDALEGSVIGNDNQVCEVHIRRTWEGLEE